MDIVFTDRVNRILEMATVTDTVEDHQALKKRALIERLFCIAKNIFDNGEGYSYR